MRNTRAAVIWILVLLGLATPLLFATTSPYLQWRSAVYIGAGFAGILALVMLAVQPLLISNAMPGTSSAQNRKAHRVIGAVLLMLVILHVAGLWWESPPDVLDALLFRSPTPFAIWGVIAMWAVFLTALLAVLRKPLKLRPKIWRLAHKSLAVIIVAGSIVHAVLVLGAMETITKILLCAIVAVLTAMVVVNLSPGALLAGRHRQISETNPPG